MIYPGQDLKFRITTEITGFSMDDCKFCITVLDLYGRRRYSVTKDECFQDSEGRWYFTMENTRRGIYFARFETEIPDDDFDDFSRKFIDVRLLVPVGYNYYCCPTVHGFCCRQKYKIHYELVWTADLDDGTYLADATGALIITSDGKRIKIGKR